jgi:hypothetical protein
LLAQVVAVALAVGFVVCIMRHVSTFVQGLADVIDDILWLYDLAVIFAHLPPVLTSGLELSRHPLTTSRLVASIATTDSDLKSDRIVIFDSMYNHLHLG